MTFDRGGPLVWLSGSLGLRQIDPEQPSSQTDQGRLLTLVRQRIIASAQYESVLRFSKDTFL